MSFSPGAVRLKRPGTVLYSDLDGTLIGPEGVSEENKAAVRRLVEAGGGFSVATGRTPSIAAPYVRDLPLTLPAVVFNGAAVYDFDGGRYLHQWNLPAGQGRAILEAGLAAYPQACAQACRVDSLALLNPGGLMDDFIVRESQEYHFNPEDDCDGCLKVMLWGEHEPLERALEAVLRSGAADGTEYLFSSPYYLEFLPRGVSKGAGLSWICETYGISRERLAAIGDYDNDVELLRAAALAACPEGASEAARREAAVTVASCARHAVADLIGRYLLA